MLAFSQPSCFSFLHYVIGFFFYFFFLSHDLNVFIVGFFVVL